MNIQSTRYRRAIAAIVLSIALGGTAQGAHLAIVPETPNTVVGGLLNVTVSISELLDGMAPSLGGFDLDVSFDAAVLSPSSISFGSGLDVLGLGSFQLGDFSTPGIANVIEVSFDSIEDLDSMQTGAFALFTLTFQAIGSGTSALGIGLNSLSNSAGTGTLDATIANSSVDVTPVPLPAAVWLLLSGFAGLGLMRRSQWLPPRWRPESSGAPRGRRRPRPASSASCRASRIAARLRRRRVSRTRSGRTPVR